MAATTSVPCLLQMRVMLVSDATAIGTVLIASVAAASPEVLHMTTFLVHATLFIGYGIGGYLYGVWTARRSQQQQTNAGMIVAHIKLAPCRSCNGLDQDCPGCLGHGYIPEEQLGVIANNPSVDLRKLEDLFDSLKNQHRYGK